MIKPITLTRIKYIAVKLAEDTMTWDEPIPPFITRYPNILESCIFTPFQKFDKKLFIFTIRKNPFVLILPSVVQG